VHTLRHLGPVSTIGAEVPTWLVGAAKLGHALRVSPDAEGTRIELWIATPGSMVA
jgi:hypothetical protein